MAGLDIDEFAKEMFTVSASTEGRSLYEMINQDVKFYDIRGCKLAISQIITGSAKQLRTDSVSVQPAIDRFVTRKRVDLAVVVFTSIVENGSVVFCGGDRAGWGQEAFPDRENEEHSFQEGLMSRKQQILPRITEIIEHYI
jgi:manganese-dependent inorganic pyrophosphatase